MVVVEYNQSLKKETLLPEIHSSAILNYVTIRKCLEKEYRIANMAANQRPIGGKLFLGLVGVVQRRPFTRPHKDLDGCLLIKGSVTHDMSVWCPTDQPWPFNRWLQPGLDLCRVLSFDAATSDSVWAVGAEPLNREC